MTVNYMSHTYESAPLKVCLMAMDWLWEHSKNWWNFFFHFFFFFRSEEYLSVIYVYDCYLQDDLFRKCAKNVIRTGEVLDSMRF